ncbi:unnamed protein product [Dracunculus medinensis]|uniref:SGNH domain-containing protein n=1 Tax=Dracunculus medinensis TaxID=318479 RepID=A0A0N4URL1_DRAME|nr:unnamed protein product [Dracunculus medinensis]
MNDSFMATSRVKVNSTAVLSVSTTPVPHDGAKSFRIYLRNRLMIKRYYPIEPNDLHIYDDTFFDGLTSERNVPVHMVYVNGTGNTTAVLFGDSFAYTALYYIIQAFGPERLGHIKRCARYGCTPILSYSEDSSTSCNILAKSCLTVIHRMKPDIVFLNFQFEDAILSKIENITTDSIVKKLQKTIDELMLSTKRIVLTYDHPHSPFLAMANLALNNLVKLKSMDEFNIPYNLFWEKHRYGYERLDAIKCAKCERLFTYRWFCDTEISKTNCAMLIRNRRSAKNSNFRFVIHSTTKRSYCIIVIVVIWVYMESNI